MQQPVVEAEKLRRQAAGTEGLRQQATEAEKLREQAVVEAETLRQQRQRS